MLDAKKTDTVVPAKAGTQRLILTVPEFPEEPGASLRRYDDAQGAIDWRKPLSIRAATSPHSRNVRNALLRTRGRASSRAS
jgi:hypothetical protein